MQKVLFHLPLHRFRSVALLLLSAILTSGLTALTHTPETDSNSAICSNRPLWAPPIAINKDSQTRSVTAVNNQPAPEIEPESHFAPVQQFVADDAEKEQEPRTAPGSPFAARGPPVR